ncbi:MAG: hypothetical protein R6U04_04470 [Bacteroidales bacterium]
MLKPFSIFLTIFLSLHGVCLGQDYLRIKADFTVKISNNNGKKNLTKGTVFYDKNIKELIYNISFPRTEKWLSKDTSLYKYREDTLVQRTTIPSINEFTVFHLALNSGLNDYGLKGSNFRIGKVEKKGDLTLSYWKIPKQLNIMIDHVVIAKKDNRLESVIMVGDNQEIISKQFFRNYIKIDAFEFPGQIIQVMYDSEGKENYQVTEFTNVKVNDMSNDKSYHLEL